MSKFNIQLDENGNVSNVVFPKTNMEIGITYPEVIEGEEVKPTGVTMQGQALTLDQFKEVQVEKDEEGNISIGNGGSNKPWWWDIIFGKHHTASEEGEG